MSMERMQASTPLLSALLGFVIFATSCVVFFHFTVDDALFPSAIPVT